MSFFSWNWSFPLALAPLRAAHGGYFAAPRSFSLCALCVPARGMLLVFDACNPFARAKTAEKSSFFFREAGGVEREFTSANCREPSVRPLWRTRLFPCGEPVPKNSLSALSVPARELVFPLRAQRPCARTGFSSASSASLREPCSCFFKPHEPLFSRQDAKAAEKCFFPRKAGGYPRSPKKLFLGVPCVLTPSPLVACEGQLPEDRILDHVH